MRCFLTCQCIFYTFFLKKRCTNSRFDTIFNKTQFCYDTEIPTKSSRTEKKGRKSKELMMLLQYIIQNCWGFRKQNLRKKTRVFIFMRRKSGSKHDFKVQLFWEDHKISQLSSNCFDKSADLLSKCQNKWKITPNFCGLLRKAELYPNENIKYIIYLELRFARWVQENIPFWMS